MSHKPSRGRRGRPAVIQRRDLLEMARLINSGQLPPGRTQLGRKRRAERPEVWDAAWRVAPSVIGRSRATELKHVASQLVRAYLPCETELLFQVKGRPALRPYRRSSLIDFLGSAQTAVDLAAEQQRQVDQLNALFEPQRALIESCRKLTEPLEAMRRLFNVS